MVAIAVAPPRSRQEKASSLRALADHRHRFGNPVKAKGGYANDTDERNDRLIRNQSRLQAGANQRRCAERKGLYARALSSTNKSRKQNAGARVREAGVALAFPKAHPGPMGAENRSPIKPMAFAPRHLPFFLSQNPR
jgi:hypothetical protein